MQIINNQELTSRQANCSITKLRPDLKGGAVFSNKMFLLTLKPLTDMGLTVSEVNFYCMIAWVAGDSGVYRGSLIDLSKRIGRPLSVLIKRLSALAVRREELEGEALVEMDGCVDEGDQRKVFDIKVRKFQEWGFYARS